ncbi:MAG: MoaD/ThiS family protein [Anaerolineae bacterium]|nr:MoaD/ThiS family protein [Anaerolineae bacterium]MCA9892788.1 MoaD/ThiS family protein [Anaerolineae bacterium]
MITVTLPTHLRALAKVSGAIELDIAEPITQETILDALEEAYPMLRGTIRDIATKQRRPFIRFFACGEDLSHQPATASVPPEVIQGKQPFRIIGAMAGG